MTSVFDRARTTISNGRPERKDVTARIEEWKRQQAEEDRKNEALPKDQRRAIYRGASGSDSHTPPL